MVVVVVVVSRMVNDEKCAKFLFVFDYPMVIVVILKRSSSGIS
jgi:hypothetical protein